MTAVSSFIRDLRRDPSFAAADHELLAKTLEDLDLLGDNDANARSLAGAYEFILGQQSLTLEQRMQHVLRLGRLIEQVGRIENLDLQEFIRLQ